MIYIKSRNITEIVFKNVFWFAVYTAAFNKDKYIYIIQVKQERPLTPSKDDHKMRCILEALQVQIYKSKR